MDNNYLYPSIMDHSCYAVEIINYVIHNNNFGKTSCFNWINPRRDAQNFAMPQAKFKQRPRMRFVASFKMFEHCSNHAKKTKVDT